MEHFGFAKVEHNACNNRMRVKQANNNTMHAKLDLRVFLSGEIAGSGSVIVSVTQLDQKEEHGC